MHYIIIGFTILLLIMGGVVTHLKSQNDKLNAKTGELTEANKTLNASVSHLTNAVATLTRELTTVVNKTATIQTEVDKQKEIFKKHTPEDINKIALRKPELLEKRVNEGTQKVFNHLEQITSPTYVP